MTVLRKYWGMLVSRGFFHLLSVNFLTQFLGLGAVLVLTVFFTPKELGMAKVIHSYAALLILIGTFGFNAAILKVCSESGWSTEARSFLVAACLKWVLLASLASYLIMLVLHEIGLIADGVYSWLVVYGLVIPFAAVSNILISYLQAQRKVKEMAKTQAYVRVSFFVLVLLSTYYYGFSGFIFSTIASYFAGFVAFLVVSKINPRDVLSSVSDSRVFGFAYYTFWGAVISVVSQHVDVYVLEGVGVPYDVIGFLFYCNIICYGGFSNYGNSTNNNHAIF